MDFGCQQGLATKKQPYYVLVALVIPQYETSGEGPFSVF